MTESIAASDFLLGMLIVASVFTFAYAVFPALLAILERVLKRKWGRR